MDDEHGIVYRVNGQDEIVSVNEEWDRFAAANDGEMAKSSRVLLRPLWDFIVGPTTQALYRQAMKQARTGQTLRFTFRCDSPTCRRLLEMRVAGLGEGSVEFSTRTISLENRLPPVFPEPGVTRPRGFLRVCSWCAKVFAGGSWVEVEEGIARLQLLERSIEPLATHGICERCNQEMLDTLALNTVTRL